MITLEEVREAADRLLPILRPTPLEHVHAVSSAVARDVWVKEEQLQRTGSYKIRGAYNLISQLSAGETVVAASAGNHAQGVALASKLTAHKCHVFMPRRAPIPKIEATEHYGAEITLVDGDLEACIQVGKAYAASTGGVFVPPFDHPHVIAGQGTIGLELVRDLPEHIETVIVPVGGGGLISGISMVLKTLRPNIRVVGVEAAGAPTMSRSIREGHPVRLDETSTMADGIAMREVSQLTFDHVTRYVDDLVVVTEAEISHAIIILLERAKAVVEPGAATSLAAILSGEVAGDGAVCAVLSGGNVDPVLLMKLIDHGLTSSGRYAVVRSVLPDRPGQLAEITRLIADLGINVVDIEHHRTGHHLETDQIEIEITLEARGHAQHHQLLDVLNSQGFRSELI